MSFNPVSSSSDASVVNTQTRQFSPDTIAYFFARAKEIINNRINSNRGVKPSEIRIIVVNKIPINTDTEIMLTKNLRLLQNELAPTQLILHLDPWELKTQIAKPNGIIEARVNLGLFLPIKLENGELLSSQNFMRILHSPPPSYN